jgi:hypothetical protein
MKPTDGRLANDGGDAAGRTTKITQVITGRQNE